MDDVRPAASAARISGLSRWSIDHPVVVATGVGGLARLAFALLSFLLNPHWLIPDEGQYVELATFVADGRGAERWFPFYGESLYRSTFAFSATVARLFSLLWPTRLLAQLVAVAAGTAAVAIATRLAVLAVGPRRGLLAGLVLAVFPSQILFSSVALRESMVWMGMLLVALAVAEVSRRRGYQATVVPVVLASAGLLVLGSLRDQTMVPVAWAFLLTVLLLPSAQKRVLVAASLLVVLLVPVAGGAGLGGYTFVSTALPTLGLTRTKLALDAESAISPPTTFQSEAPAGGRGHSTTTTTIIARHLRDGQQVIDGPEGRYYLVDDSASASIHRIPQGLAATLLRPFPWERLSNVTVTFAAVENVAWYALYALALVGAVVGRRRWRTMLFPGLSILVIVGVAAVSQGNIGTAFRHRAQILWAIVLLAAVGVDELLARHRYRPGVDEARAEPDALARAGA